MFELRLVQGSLLKKVLEAIKDLVKDARFECSGDVGFSMQAMDSSQAALVSLLLRPEGFNRCHGSYISMGMNLTNMVKMLKCAGSNDIISLRADNNTDVVTFLFENPSRDRISDFEMKLMNIDCPRVGVKEIEPHATIRMSSTEFSRICKDLSSIGDTVVISVTEEGAKFSTRGDIGTVNVACKHNTNVARPEDATIIEMKVPVSLTCGLRYLNSFTKATPLSDAVTISLTSQNPVAVEYRIADMGYLRFDLAPKIDNEELS